MQDNTIILQLRDIIRDGFDQNEFDSLCVRLGISSEELSGKTSQSRALSLVRYHKRRKSISRLIEAIQLERPDIDLSSLLAKDEAIRTERINKEIPSLSDLHVIESAEEDVINPKLNSGESQMKEIVSQNMNIAPDAHNTNAQDIAFANRVYELERLLNPLGPMYTLVDAPAGFGKTRLLQELKNRYASLKQDGNIWTCISIDLRNNKLLQSRSIIIDAVGSQIKDYIRLESTAKDDDRIEQCAYAIYQIQDKGHVVLTFDSVENIHRDMLSWFIFDFIIQIYEYLNDIGFHGDGRKFRVIFAGRYVASRWEALTYGKMVLSIMQLRPFDLVAIIETVRGVINNISNEDTSIKILEEGINELSYNIMRITGGHPGCIAAILRQLIEKKFIGFRRYADRDMQRELYQHTVKPVIDMIKLDIPEHLRQAFSMLSIYRRFNREAIGDLLDNKKLHLDGAESNDPAWELLQDMRSTHLIERRNGYYSDAIVRSLLAIELRQDRPKLFQELCEQAAKFYRSLIEGLGNANPHLIVIEALYQQLQLHIIDRKPPRSKILENMQDTIRLHLALERPYTVREELIEDLRTAINADWELRYLAKDILGDNDLQTVLLSGYIKDSPNNEASDVQ